VHPSGTYGLSHLFNAALAALAEVVVWRLYLGKANLDAASACRRLMQKFAAVHSSVHNHFNQERHHYSRGNFKTLRAAALAEWRQLGTI